MLDPPNGDFYGYLGVGHGAWAYDAFEGVIVSEYALLTSKQLTKS